VFDKANEPSVTIRSTASPNRFHQSLSVHGDLLLLSTVLNGEDEKTWSVSAEDAVRLRDWLNAHVVSTPRLLP
jgi:hypothetical protein